MNLIKTIKDQCHECYACVRNCPAKAVRVREGQAEVIDERCINCANCVKICSQGAKKVKDDKDIVSSLLQNEERVVVGLAPSFPAYNSELGLAEWTYYLKEFGFAEVYEVAWGAQLIVEEYKRYLETNDDLVISTACPVIVNYVEKYCPELVSNLAPIVSPMGALVRYICQVEEEDVKIVLIGPCHAKKGEFAGCKDVSAVLTYSEAVELGKDFKEIEPEALHSEDEVAITGFSDSSVKSAVKCTDSVDNNITDNSKEKSPDDLARKIPIAGGLLEAVGGNKLSDDFIKVEGRERVSQLFESIINGEIYPRFIDALFCEGCINGVDLAGESYFKKENAVNRFIKLNGRVSFKKKAFYSKEKISEVDLDTSFKEDHQDLPQPSEVEIWDILNNTNKYEEDDLLNCSACGYNSCREKAVAVYQGLAEVEMCLPYLLSEKRSEVKEVQDLNRELDSLINSSYDGMMVVNNQGYIERVNESYLQMIGVSRQRLLGKKVIELEEERVIYPSVSILCLREKRNITIVQNTYSGKRILVTATPILTEKGQIVRVIVNARDLKELDVVVGNSAGSDKENIFLDQSEQVIKTEGTGHIISHSPEMKGILRLAQKIGNTDSTVLITGESGVGKEVVARYIHEQSKERDNLVKINCAAIPERLLESELFGYETGAFSGARREGKPGLIEKADNGTLFLDEIGEMPLNMQAKLLQVIQEHRVTRIGGVEPIEVNFRLITATNKVLKEMVAENKFREDLYYRLNVVPIEIPPLRQRRSDILPLVNYFSNQLNEKYERDIEFNREARQLLQAYDWPGNVRELTNLLERVIVTTEEQVVDEEFLRRFIDFERMDEGPGIIVNDILPLKEAVALVEKEILGMVKEEDMTTYEMAKILGVNQSTVVRKLKKYFE